MEAFDMRFGVRPGFRRDRTRATCSIRSVSYRARTVTVSR